MSETPIDVMQPWTIKAVPTDIRNKVTTAARKEGLTIGQWLERHVNEWLEDGGPVQVSGLPALPGAKRPTLPPVDIESLSKAAATLKDLDALEPRTAVALNRMIRRLSKP